MSLGHNECRFAVTPHDAREHLFCGEVTPDDKPYCTHHQKICGKGYGVSPESLERMIYWREDTIIRNEAGESATGYAPNTAPVDVEVARRLKK